MSESHMVKGYHIAVTIFVLLGPKLIVYLFTLRSQRKMRDLGMCFNSADYKTYFSISTERTVAS